MKISKKIIIAELLSLVALATMFDTVAAAQYYYFCNEDKACTEITGYGATPPEPDMCEAGYQIFKSMYECQAGAGGLQAPTGQMYHCQCNELNGGAESCSMEMEYPDYTKCKPTNDKTCAWEKGYCPQTSLGSIQSSTPPQLTKPVDELVQPSNAIYIPYLKYTNINPKMALDEQGYLYIPWIGEFLSAIYKVGIIIGSILAAVMIIIAGARIVGSGGGEEKSTAYKDIGRSVIGLAILWGSYITLSTINPKLVTFNSLKIKYVPEISTEDSGSVITDYDITSPGEGTNGVPLFKQSNYKQAYGECGTIQSSGCGPTSMAMVMKFYGANVDPLVVANSFAAQGFRACSGGSCESCRGTYYGAFVSSKLLKQNGLTGKLLNGWDEVSEALKSNKPVIAAVTKDAMGKLNGKNTWTPFTNGGHFIVLTGIREDGDTTYIDVNDPAKAINVTTKDFLMKGLKNSWLVSK